MNNPTTKTIAHHRVKIDQHLHCIDEITKQLEAKYAPKPTSTIKNKSKACTVEVAGLNWALCNLGTDVDNPHGKYYTFDEAQKAVPDGWRLPTGDEFQQLHDRTTHKWIKQNGLNGMLFTDKDNGNELFLPAAGYREYSAGALTHVGAEGVYWSSSIGTATYGLALNFLAAWVHPQTSDYRLYGFTLRCVQ